MIEHHIPKVKAPDLPAARAAKEETTQLPRLEEASQRKAGLQIGRARL